MGLVIQTPFPSLEGATESPQFIGDGACLTGFIVCREKINEVPGYTKSRRDDKSNEPENTGAFFSWKFPVGIGAHDRQKRDTRVASGALHPKSNRSQC